MPEGHDKFPTDVQKEIIALAWPPDYVVYKPREDMYKFPLKKGEETKFIHVTATTDIYSNNSKYEIVLRNGKIIKVWAGEKFNNLDEFKFRAVEDTVVGIKVGNVQ